MVQGAHTIMVDVFDIHASFCRIFTNPNRVRMVWALREGEKTVSELAEIIHSSAFNASRYLVFMRSQGAVKTRREGRSSLCSERSHCGRDVPTGSLVWRSDPSISCGALPSDGGTRIAGRCAMSRLAICFVSVLATSVAVANSAGCAAADSSETHAAPFVDHDEASDFDPVYDDSGKADGISPSSFDPNTIVKEVFFTNTEAVDGDGVQSFFEDTPYGNRSFLADETIGGARAADVIVEASQHAGLNPIVMLARMQVEKSLVGKSQRPSSSSLDWAFGCGCPDGRSCYEGYRGFDKQVACAADTLAELHGESVAGTGQWRRGHQHRTSDGRWVTPSNHGTAALYGYTPWVLRGRGGNWLVWNITRRFALHFLELGLLQGGLEEQPDSWIGAPCDEDSDCDFSASGEVGFCFTYDETAGTAGFCSLVCEGYCPDRSGHARTFCVDSPDSSGGMCAAKSESENDDCGDLPGTSPQETARYVGSSGASQSSAVVCLP